MLDQTNYSGRQLFFNFISLLFDLLHQELVVGRCLQSLHWGHLFHEWPQSRVRIIRQEIRLPWLGSLKFFLFLVLEIILSNSFVLAIVYISFHSLLEWIFNSQVIPLRVRDDDGLTLLFDFIHEPYARLLLLVQILKHLFIQHPGLDSRQPSAKFVVQVFHLGLVSWIFNFLFGRIRVNISPLDFLNVGVYLPLDVLKLRRQAEDNIGQINIVLDIPFIVQGIQLFNFPERNLPLLILPILDSFELVLLLKWVKWSLRFYNFPMLREHLNLVIPPPFLQLFFRALHIRVWSVYSLVSF